MVKIICYCGKTLEFCEEGVNGSDYYECECGKVYNIIESEVEKENEI